ncbi:MAG: Re/Si-specific NAD(P)(+) transhydrogenase subunit alpha [Gammaproteobacteria bacterium]|nr:Re/Si-specific NAD(P)(+) transhydrogenase subunit alpha [Gammaproteobacteria bacterium]
MPIRVTVGAETQPGERRVALVPEVIARMSQQGFDIQVAKSAGAGANLADSDFVAAGAVIVPGSETMFNGTDIIVRVQAPTVEEISRFPEGVVLIGLLQPHRHPDVVKALQARRITSFSMELLPRISRAQSMDVLSSQATVAGYQAALIGARLSPRFFPMLTTAAGTIRPAKVLVLGAGVAGLQAIATARRLGAIVEAYDVRAAAAEQVESLGAKFLKIDVKAEAEGGYARELTDEEKQLQQTMLANAIKAADVVITTAQIPGRPAPKMISAEMVAGMKAGAVIVDLAAETGGNCELTRCGETVAEGGVTICGPRDIASDMSVHASDMYARNLQRFMELMKGEDGALKLDWEDEIIAGTVLTHDGEIRHPATRELLEGAAA